MILLQIRNQVSSNGLIYYLLGPKLLILRNMWTIYIIRTDHLRPGDSKDFSV